MDTKLGKYRESRWTHYFCFFTCIGIVLGLYGCQFWGKKSIVSEPIPIVRFDEDLAKFDLKDFATSDQKMFKKYGDLYTFYIQDLMGLGSQQDPHAPDYYEKYMAQFLNGEYAALMDSFRGGLFSHIPQWENELGVSYAYLHKEFPEKKKSVIYGMFISPMAANSSSAFSYGHDTIGVNWFYYMGRNFSLYKSVFEGYNYMTEWNQPEYLVRNVMLVEYNLLKEKWMGEATGDELLQAMIEDGKKYYFLDIVCPDMSDRVKIGYSEAQMKWCKENELEIWAYFGSNKLLNSIDPMEIRRYTTEGPNSPGMPVESPGMTGSFIGWQIVKKYASQSGKSLKDVLTTSPKEIYLKAGYKPAKK